MREAFYKYTDINTAVSILKSRSFRYSSPLLFNDPFDIQNELVASFDLESLPIKTFQVMEHYILSEDKLPNNKTPFAEGILFFREKVKKYGYKKDEIKKMSLRVLDSVKEDVQNLIVQINRTWQVSMKESRVFCVTESFDNLLMWAHYADSHNGLVFEIKTLPEKDTPLIAAKKVVYEEKPILFFSIDEVINHVLFDVNLNHKEVSYVNYAHRKSKIWNYEKEWRVVDPLNYKNKTEKYVDHQFISEQIQGIYFGCKTCSKDIDEIRSLSIEINPNVKFYKAKKRITEYELDFENLNEGS